MPEPCPHEFAEPESYGICTLCGEPAPWSAMPEPTREAREAAESATPDVYAWFAARPDQRENMTTPREALARALDAFAEKWRGEAAISGRAIEIVYETLGANPREIEVVKRIQELNAAEQERDALRRRVAELTEQTINDNETLDELISTLPCGHMRGGQMEDQHGLYCPTCRVIAQAEALEAQDATMRANRDDWKARAERAEKALDNFIDEFEGDFVLHGEIVDNPEKLWSPLADLYQEARRARGEGK